MTLAQLYYLVALDTHRHFRQAASFLGISQPGLSSQLSRLEEELGVTLFNRNAKPVEPTPVGMQVIAQARIILEETERLKSLVHGHEAFHDKNLRIGLPSSLAPHVLASAIAAFNRWHPGISIDIEEMRSDLILEALQRDALDAAIVVAGEALRGMRDRRLFDEPLVCYVSGAHPMAQKDFLQASDLESGDLWVLKPGHSLRDQVLALFREEGKWYGEKRSIRLACDSIEMLKVMVEENCGLTVLPWLAVYGDERVKPELVRNFSEPVPYRTVRLLYQRRLEPSPLIESLVLCIQQAVRPLLPSRWQATMQLESEESSIG